MFLQGVEYRVVVEVPQLTALIEQFAFLNEQINQYGERLMASFDEVSARVTELTDALNTLATIVQTENDQVIALLQRVTTLLEGDMTDQSQVDAIAQAVSEATQRVSNTSTQIANFVPDDPTPEPIP